VRASNTLTHPSKHPVINKRREEERKGKGEEEEGEEEEEEGAEGDEEDVELSP
jgi:hypothetical protein